MSYSMGEAISVAKQATVDITDWLTKRPETIALRNVELDLDFQRRDVDLIWTTQTDELWLEIKGDRWHQTGNFFFETHSNLERETPGCFLYTEAHWLLYYFVIPRTLYWLPMQKTREWFISNIEQFQERSTTTPVREDIRYTTVGRLVPIDKVMRQVDGTKKEQL